MDIKKDVDDYPLPPMSHLASVVIYSQGDPRENPTSVAWRCVPISAAEMQRFRTTPASGLPQYIALMPDTTGAFSLALYPCPDRDTVAVVRYAPPLVEI